jgi:hypothetical protein
VLGEPWSARALRDAIFGNRAPFRELPLDTSHESPRGLVAVPRSSFPAPTPSRGEHASR